MAGERKVLLVSAGASHTVALLSGQVVCSFGRGEDGQLGHGDAEDRLLPRIIGALNDCEISLVACGADHTTAYSATRLTIYSWGWGDFGRLGHGNSSDLFVPHPIKALQGLEIRQIACGDSHCLAVTADGEVYSWGRNQNGQLGLGDTDDSLVPHKLLAFEGVSVKMLAAGAEHTAAVTDSGKLYGWGWGRYGNLGLGDRGDRMLPAEVPAVGDEKMCMVACGWRHTIAVSQSGKLYTYGWSKYGQLGHGDYADHLLPHQVAALAEFNITQVSGGWRHTVALTEAGKLYGWGWNKFGQVGSGDVDDHTSPQLISIPGQHQRVVQVSCGWRHTVAVTDKNNVYSWGRGTSGQLGHGDAVDRSAPKGIQALSADGSACEGLEKSPEPAVTGSGVANWISPSERYAVVPDEAVLVGQMGDASVPDTDIKRIRTD
ncbi:hypothetical protein SELMODRAFT_179009 [Selaginella moellendorffii]|uniref:RCC1-like domain-containing protein n=1 Tax=Selaginella moellendorffii TaxID=88036 RepID=D8SE46_SELML|nr:ultraviolet-B receptor UVR8 [Selaginella moellendorffii]EFJ17371.1 hypothetical protein SELMODRAFT_179009 [Selaginella moellendorffii]|eukprot:XP_002981556.1 ultraviolet-B receptor UVR8 [Selaginella moellendorffii]